MDRSEKLAIHQQNMQNAKCLVTVTGISFTPGFLFGDPLVTDATDMEGAKYISGQFAAELDKFEASLSGAGSVMINVTIEAGPEKTVLLDRDINVRDERGMFDLQTKANEVWRSVFRYAQAAKADRLINALRASIANIAR